MSVEIGPPATGNGLSVIDNAWMEHYIYLYYNIKSKIRHNSLISFAWIEKSP